MTIYLHELYNCKMLCYYKNEGVILLFVTTKTYQKRKGVIDEYS